MFGQLLAVGIVLSMGNRTQAQVFEIETVMYRGDPSGSRKAGTLKIVSAPTIVSRSGERGSLLVGGSVPIRTPDGVAFVDVGRQVHVIATAVDGGGIKVEATSRHIEVAGKGPQISTAATIQPGGKVRIELGKDPKDLLWAEITVRKAK